MQRFWTATALLLLAVLFVKKGSAQSVNNGLVGYYTFCDCTPKDMSGNNRHGTMAGTPQCIRGMRDYGLLLNQVPGDNGCGQAGGQYIQLPQLGPIWEEGFTVSAWVRFDEIKSYERIIDFGNSHGEAGGVPIWFGREGNSNTLTLESWVDANSNQARSTGRLAAPNVITNGSIEYYVATIRGDTMRIYVNGVLVAQKRGNPIANVSRTNNFIGRSNWCFADPDFKGFMDEVRIYNRALSLEEIQRLYRTTNVRDFTAKTICNTRQIAFSSQNAADIDSLKWDFGDPGSGALNTATGQDATHSFPAVGTYKVRLIAYKNCLNDTVIKDVQVYPSGYFLGDDFELCPGQSKALKPGLTGVSFQWQNGTSLDSFVVTQPGLYWLQIGIDGCSYRDSITVTSAQRSSLQTVAICDGETYLGYSKTGIYRDSFPLLNGCDSIRTINLTVQTKIVSTLDTVICDGQTYLGHSTAGLYTDTLRYATGCDSVIRTLRLLVKAPRSEKTSATICQGESYLLPGGQTVTSPGTYSDTLRYLSGCDSLRREVQLNILPLTVESTAASVCTGNAYTLPWGPVVNTTGTYRDTARYRGGCDSLIREVKLLVMAPKTEQTIAAICTGDRYTLPWGTVVENGGMYRDTLRTAVNCDSVIRTVLLTVHQPPVVSVSKTNDINCVMGISKLLVTGGTAYTWTPAASLDNAGSNQPTASPDRTTLYHVRVTNSVGCIAEDSIRVMVTTGNADEGYPVPNAFTPNGDGKNDCFGVPYWGAVEAFSISIYNRWGEMVFHARENSACWNGAVNGRRGEAGTYIYLIQAKTRCGEVLRKGTVLLVR